MSIHIRPMESGDWSEVLQIYMAGIATGNATFQSEAPSWEEWDRGHLKACRLVAVVDGTPAGWAALSPISNRCVYKGVAEVSIYVCGEKRGSGVGTALMAALVKESEAEGFWTLQAGIFPENVASLALHGKFGFREVGRREKLGQMKGVWRDVLLLERRSTVL